MVLVRDRGVCQRRAGVPLRLLLVTAALLGAPPGVTAGPSGTFFVSQGIPFSQGCSSCHSMASTPDVEVLLEQGSPDAPLSEGSQTRFRLTLSNGNTQRCGFRVLAVGATLSPVETATVPGSNTATVVLAGGREIAHAIRGRFTQMFGREVCMFEFNALADPGRQEVTLKAVGNTLNSSISGKWDFLDGDLVLPVLAARPRATVSPMFLSATTTVPDAPPEQGLTIGNTGAASLDYTVTADQAWLRAEPASGMLPSGGAAQHLVRFDPTLVGNLPGGRHTAELLVTTVGVPAEPLRVRVDLFVENGAFRVVTIPGRSPLTGSFGQGRRPLAVIDDLIAIGDPDAAAGGAVFIYEPDGEGWRFTRVVRPLSPEPTESGFGTSVALSRSLVGSAELGVASRNGAVYFFRRHPQDGGWDFLQREPCAPPPCHPDDTCNAECLVAVDTSRVVMTSGTQAIVLRVNHGAWIHEDFFPLPAFDPTVVNRRGHAVALIAGTSVFPEYPHLLVGSTFNERGPGAEHWSDTSVWKNPQFGPLDPWRFDIHPKDDVVLRSPDPEAYFLGAPAYPAGEQFGAALDAHERPEWADMWAIIGNPWDWTGTSPPDFRFPGSAFILRKSIIDERWFLDRVLRPEPESTSNFGEAVAIGPGRAVVGSWRDVRLFERNMAVPFPGTPWRETFRRSRFGGFLNVATSHGSRPTTVVGGSGDEVLVIEPPLTMPDASIVKRPGGIVTASGWLLAEHRYFFDLVSTEDLRDSVGHPLTVTWNARCPDLTDSGVITPQPLLSPNTIRWLTPANCDMAAKRERCTIGATLDNGFGLRKTVAPLEFEVLPERHDQDNDHDGFDRLTEVHKLGTDPCVFSDPYDILVDVTRRLLRRSPDTFGTEGRRRARALLRRARSALRRGNAADAAGYLVTLREGLSGCPPEADADDLIVNCEVQGYYRGIIDQFIALLSPGDGHAP